MTALAAVLIVTGIAIGLYIAVTIADIITSKVATWIVIFLKDKDK